MLTAPQSARTGFMAKDFLRLAQKWRMLIRLVPFHLTDSPMKTTILRAALWTFISTLPFSAQAEEDRDAPLPDRGDGYLTFYFDNDVFTGTDEGYTNGARLTWVSRNLQPDEMPRTHRYLRALSGDAESLGAFQSITGFRDPKDVQYNYGFSLSQLMFTPEDSQPYTQPVGQRRYAGWLALGISLHAKDDHVLNSIELSLGTTGKHALAENTQDIVHDAINDAKFNGWDNQIPNEFTVDLSFVQKRRIDFIKWNYGQFRMDAISEWGARLGTFRTGAHIGSMVRIGFNLPPDFSDARLSDTAYSHQYFDTNDPYVGNWSVYLLGGFEGRLALHDATLDGPLFRDFKTGNHREPLVGELYAGLGIRYSDFELSFVHTIRTDEYENEAGHTEYGSVALRVRF